MIPVYRSEGILSAADVAQLSRFPLKDWWSADTSTEISCAIAVDEGRLWVSYRAVPACAHAAGRPGEFVEGLWLHDVFELFVCDDNGNQYQEFNFSPTGAWWSCRFRNYRERDTALIEQVAAVYPSPSQGKETTLVASYPLASLVVSCQFESRSKLNVAAISHHPQTHYFSFAPCESDKPDFHRTGCFENVELQSVELPRA